MTWKELAAELGLVADHYEGGDYEGPILPPIAPGDFPGYPKGPAYGGPLISRPATGASAGPTGPAPSGTTKDSPTPGAAPVALWSGLTEPLAKAWADAWAEFKVKLPIVGVYLVLVVLFIVGWVMLLNGTKEGQQLQALDRGPAPPKGGKSKEARAAT